MLIKYAYMHAYRLQGQLNDMETTLLEIIHTHTHMHTYRLQGQLNDMETTLLEKETLLHELVKNQRDFDAMRNAYERKMFDMQKDISKIEQERDKVCVFMYINICMYVCVYIPALF
jgi:hypothetical protein